MSLLGPDEREFLIQFRRSLRGLEIAIDRYFQASNKRLSESFEDKKEPIEVGK